MLGWFESRRYRVVRCEDLRAAVQPHDARRPFEGAEHDRDAPVFAHVRDRLGSAADEVEVRDLTWAEDAKPAHVALRRDVDVPVRRERRRADEEQVLLLDPGGEARVDLVEDLAHAGSLARHHVSRCAGSPSPPPC